MALQYKNIFLEKDTSEIYLRVEIAKNPFEFEKEDYFTVLEKFADKVEEFLLPSVADGNALTVCIGGDDDLEVRYDGFTFDQQGIRTLEEWHNKLMEYFEEDNHRLYVTVRNDYCTCIKKGILEQEDVNDVLLDFMRLEEFLAAVSIIV